MIAIWGILQFLFNVAASFLDCLVPTITAALVTAYVVVIWN